MKTARQITMSTVRMAPSLTILAPAYNECKSLEPTVDHLLQALTVPDFEIIIVDDGSTDSTGEIADRLATQNPNIRVIHNPGNMGLGYSYLRGIDAASKNFFIYVPADDTWPLQSLVEMFGMMGKKDVSADIITSYASNPEIRPLGRRIVSLCYTRLVNLLFGHRLKYYNGLTIYPITFLRSSPITTHGFGFQAEALLKAIDRGLTVSAIPLPIDERVAGRSKAVTVKNIVSVLTTLTRLFWELRVAPRLTYRVAPHRGRH